MNFIEILSCFDFFNFGFCVFGKLGSFFFVLYVKCLFVNGGFSGGCFILCDSFFIKDFIKLWEIILSIDF